MSRPSSLPVPASAPYQQFSATPLLVTSCAPTGMPYAQATPMCIPQHLGAHVIPFPMPVLMPSYQALPHPGMNLNRVVFSNGKGIINAQTLRKNYRTQRRRATQTVAALNVSTTAVALPVPKKRKVGQRKGSRRKKYSSMLHCLVGQAHFSWGSTLSCPARTQIHLHV
jgi:hypothetical protein